MGLEPAMDGPPVWIVTVMPCALAQRTIGAASLPVFTEPRPISPTSFTPAAAISLKSASVRPSSKIGAPASTLTPPGRKFAYDFAATMASALRPTMSLGRPGRCTSPAEIAVVTPPCMAESMKSTVRWRGVKSPKTGCTWESMRPGITVVPRQSMTVSASSSRPRPMPAMTPSRSTRESASRRGRRRSPLTRVPMLRRRTFIPPPNLRGGGAPVQARLHLFDVGGHDRASLAGLVGGHRLHDAPMRRVDLGAVRLAHAHLRRDDLGLERHQHVGDDGVNGIARGVGEQPVELQIEAARLAAGRCLGVALIDGGGEFLEVGLARALRRQEGHLGLDEPPRLDELCARHAPETEESGEVAHQRPVVGLAHEVAAGGALPHLDEAAQLQRAQRLAHGDTAGLEVTGELPLGRQLLALAQTALVDRAFDVGNDLLVYARRPTCHGARHCRLKPGRSQAGVSANSGRSPGAPARGAPGPAASVSSVSVLTRSIRRVSPRAGPCTPRARNHARFRLWLSRCNLAARENRGCSEPSLRNWRISWAECCDWR